MHTLRLTIAHLGCLAGCLAAAACGSATATDDASSARLDTITTAVATSTAPGSTAATTTTSPTTTPAPTSTAPPAPTTSPSTTTTTSPPLGIVDGKLVLPLVPQTGQAVRQTTEVKLSMNLVDPIAGATETSNTTTIVAERRVIAVDDGSYTVSDTIIDFAFEMPDHPEAEAQTAAQFASVVGVEVVVTYDLGGTEIGREIIGDVDPSARPLLELAPQTTIETPAGGVGVGDTWTTTVSGASLGLPIDVVSELTLTTLDEHIWSAESTSTVDAGALFAAAADEATGTMTSTGTTSGRVDHALMIDSTATVTIDAELVIDGARGSILQVQVFTITSEAI